MVAMAHQSGEQRANVAYLPQPESLFTLEFVRVDPAVKKADGVLLAITAVVLLSVGCALAVFAWHNAWWAWLILALLAGVLAWIGVLIPLRYKNFGYVETENEIILRRGGIFRNYEIIPYGRLQKVTVAQGPLSRHFGVSKLSIHTASATTDGVIKGLDAAELERLRSELTYRCAATFEGV